MEFILREACAEDAEKLIPLEKEIFLLHKEMRPELFRDMVKFFTPEYLEEVKTAPDCEFLIAESGGEIIAYVNSLIRHVREHPTYADHDIYHINDLCVAEKHRKNGVGRRIVEECINRAKARGCRYITLGVYTSNEGAVEFYKKMGMSPRTHQMELIL